MQLSMPTSSSLELTRGSQKGWGWGGDSDWAHDQGTLSFGITCSLSSGRGCLVPQAAPCTHSPETWPGEGAESWGSWHPQWERAGTCMVDHLSQQGQEPVLEAPPKGFFHGTRPRPRACC